MVLDLVVFGAKYHGAERHLCNHESTMSMWPWSPPGVSESAFRSSAYVNSAITLVSGLSSAMQCCRGRVCNSSSRSSMYTSNRNVESGSPCPTPREMGKYADMCFSQRTLDREFDSKIDTTRPSRPVTPFCNNLNNRPSRHTVSYALWISRKKA